MCGAHHDVIDAASSEFCVQTLKGFKEDHETVSRDRQFLFDTALQRLLSEFQSRSQLKKPSLGLLSLLAGTFKACVSLLVHPKTCFEEQASGDLYCEGVSPFAFWLLLTTLQMAMALLTTSDAGHFSIWFFLLQLVVVSIRMLLLVAIWVVVARLFGTGAWRNVASVCLFHVALFSLLISAATIYPMSQVTLEQSMASFLRSKEGVPINEPEALEQVLIGIAAVFGVSGYFYGPTYLVGVVNWSLLRALAFFTSANLLYAALRPVAVLPLYRTLVERLVETPWTR